MNSKYVERNVARDLANGSVSSQRFDVVLRTAGLIIPPGHGSVGSVSTELLRCLHANTEVSVLVLIFR